MFENFAVRYETPTAEEVLEILRAEADPEIRLLPATTILEWRWACELEGWRSVGQAFNAAWALDLTDSEWRALLEPARRRSLGDLCAYLAPRMRVPRISDVEVFGRRCRPAGAFLTLRAVLARAGMDVGSVRPSSALAAHVGEDPRHFFAALHLLAPRAKLPIDFDVPGKRAQAAIPWALFLGLALFSLSGPDCLGTRLPDFVALGAFAVGALLLLGALIAAYVIGPGRPPVVSFGNLVTFGDLARALARQT